jgi:hypothetical protein
MSVGIAARSAASCLAGMQAVLWLFDTPRDTKAVVVHMFE